MGFGFQQGRSMRGLRNQRTGFGCLCWLILASVLTADEPARPVNRSLRENPPARIAEGNSAALPLAPPRQATSNVSERLPGRTSAIRVGSRLAIVLGVFAAVVLIQRWLSAPVARVCLPMSFRYVVECRSTPASGCCSFAWVSGC